MAGVFPFRLEFSDLNKRIQQLKVMPLKIEIQMKKETALFLLDTLRDSKTKFPRVPVDTGALQSTGFANPPRLTAKGIEGELGYGGFAATPFNKNVDYAIVTHEDTNRSFKRPKAAPKYVEVHWTRNGREFKKAMFNILDKIAQSGLK